MCNWKDDWHIFHSIKKLLGMSSSADVQTCSTLIIFQKKGIESSL